MLLPWTMALVGTWMTGSKAPPAASHRAEALLPLALALAHPGCAHHGCPALVVAVTSLLQNPPHHIEVRSHLQPLPVANWPQSLGSPHAMVLSSCTVSAMEVPEWVLGLHQHHYPSYKDPAGPQGPTAALAEELR